jgi:glyoxylase-like metal-dependent hydrolase (beta-lactamase superfamily II)
MDASEPVGAVVADRGLVPVAVLATHGHIDHIGDAQEIADGYGIPLHIHSADRHLLSDPAAGLLPEMGDWIGAYYPEGLHEPERVELLDEWGTLVIAGLSFRVIPTPGHTEGSVTFVLKTPDDSIVFTGDTLFAGSVGRTDMPGGDWDTLESSLKVLVGELPDDALILPGHGPTSIMGDEKRANPYVRGLV